MDTTDRNRTEGALRKAHEALESRVQERTAELKKTVGELEAERQRFNDVLDVLPAYVILLTTDYHVPFANRFFRERFGDSNGRRCFEYLFGRSEPCEVCETYEVLKTGAPHRWEWTGPDDCNYDIFDFPFTDTDGSRLVLEMGIDITEPKRAAAELEQHQGQLEAVVKQRTNQLETAIAQLQSEIGEHRRTAEQLRESQRDLSHAQAVAHTGSWRLDVRQNELHWSDEIHRMFGIPKDTPLTYEAFLSAVHPEDREFVDRKWKAGLRGEPYNIEHRVVVGDEVKWVQERAELEFDSSGALIGGFGTAQDVTERKQAEEVLRQGTSRLEEANRVKDEFLATLSHEIRTPLNTILGWSQMLVRGHLDPARVQHALEVIDRNARAQVGLINDALDVSRVISGKLRLDVRRMDVAESLRATLDAVRLAAEAKRIQIVPVVGPDAIVLGDPDRMQQILWNLLSNAVKFTPQGGRVEVSVGRVDSRVEIQVRDTGVGIAPEALPHIFERFWQADRSTTREYGGLGLGLAIVRHLVELHGGSVGAESAGEGQGAVFTVSIPICTMEHGPAEAGVPQSEHALESSPSPVRSLAGIRVLVVDDDADARDLLDTVLRDFGAEVAVAATAQEGLRQLQEWRPHVVLSDIGMPGEDGYVLIRAVRMLPAERGGATPAAALTAYGSADDRIRVLAAGYDQHVTKPVKPTALADIVAALAGNAASL